MDIYKVIFRDIKVTSIPQFTIAIQNAILMAMKLRAESAEIKVNGHNFKVDVARFDQNDLRYLVQEYKQYAVK